MEDEENISGEVALRCEEDAVPKLEERVSFEAKGKQEREDLLSLFLLDEVEVEEAEEADLGSGRFVAAAGMGDIPLDADV